jgi:SNF2 family DNA or RNA helicase
MQLRPYQERGADFLFATNRAMILAPVGAGKTAMTLTAMSDMVRQKIVKRWLVIAPKRVVTDVWPIEAPKWSSGLTLSLIVGTPAKRLQALRANADVYVTNYDNLQWLAEQKVSFDGVVFDELTKLKNPTGKRFKALEKFIANVNVRWGLTGSFTSNGLEDVFGQCKIVDQTLLGRSKGAFMQRYFVLLNPEYGEWFARPGALPNIMQQIKPATYLLDAGDYKDKLPPLHTVPMYCTMDMKDYNTMKRDFVVQFPSATAIAANAAVVTGKLQQMASGFVYDSTTEANPTSPGKFTTTKRSIWLSNHKFDMLEDILQENQHANTIVVYNYQEELRELKRRYPQAKTLDDENIIKRWNDKQVELLLVHPKSAGHGLNLQYGGNKMVFLSLPWSLELFEQTVGRLHRGGQLDAVWCYLILTKGTIDERIWSALNDKRALSDITLEELKCVP